MQLSLRFTFTEAQMADRRLSQGLLIAFEGIDGSGKTTQAKDVSRELEAMGFEALYLREPTDGPFGRRLRELMVAGREAVEPMEEFRLFLADREEDVRLNIAPALKRGAIVCLDRYYISSMAYQGALGLDPEFIRTENEKIAPVPDLILYFEIPVEEGLKRIRASRAQGQNLFELQHYQERVCEMFAQMDFPQLVKVDARAPLEELHREVMEKVLELVGRLA